MLYCCDRMGKHTRILQSLMYHFLQIGSMMKTLFSSFLKKIESHIRQTKISDKNLNVNYSVQVKNNG